VPIISTWLNITYIAYNICKKYYLIFNIKSSILLIMDFIILFINFSTQILIKPSAKQFTVKKGFYILNKMFVWVLETL